MQRQRVGEKFEDVDRGSTAAARRLWRDFDQRLANLLSPVIFLGTRQLLADDVPQVKPKSEPIGFAHNGFHVDDDEKFQPLPPPAPELPRPSRHERPARHYLPENQPQKRPFWFESGRHSRDDDPDDATRYGRHSTPGRD